MPVEKAIHSILESEGRIVEQAQNQQLWTSGLFMPWHAKRKLD